MLPSGALHTNGPLIEPYLCNPCVLFCGVKGGEGGGGAFGGGNHSHNFLQQGDPTKSCANGVILVMNLRYITEDSSNRSFGLQAL